MTLNNSEFDDVRRDEDIDEPIDGRDSQPVSEGSSDAPQTLESEDPLRGQDAILDEDDEHAFGTGPLEGDDEERIVGYQQQAQAIDPGLAEARPTDQGDPRDDPDLD